MAWKMLACMAAGFLLLLGVSAQAGTLTSATWVGEFQGTPFTLLTTGASLSASGSASGTNINTVVLTVAAPVLTTLDTTGLAPVFTSQTLGGSQTLAGNTANQGISGGVNTYIGLNSSSGTLLFPVALSAGVAGNFTTTAIVPGTGSPLEVTATFFPWTTTSQVITGLTLSGAALPNVTFAGTNTLVGGVGSITLVAPTRTRVCVGAIFAAFPCVGGAPGNVSSNVLATATSLKLNFTPEPGTALLIAAAMVGLATRRRRS